MPPDALAEAGALVRAAAQRFGSRVALADGQRQFSFTGLNERANRVGSALLQQGDRVGVLGYNTAEFCTGPGATARASARTSAS
ncbi:MAG: AMP-binding protein [Streptosporangiaceae bacterium]